MVPTEVLARQHLESINELIAENELNINTVLLTGSMKAKKKRSICKNRKWRSVNYYWNTCIDSGFS